MQVQSLSDPKSSLWNSNKKGKNLNPLIVSDYKDKLLQQLNPQVVSFVSIDAYKNNNKQKFWVLQKKTLVLKWY